MFNNSDKKIANKLNKYLKGLFMGIDIFKVFTEKASNDNLKNICEKIIESYSLYIDHIKETITSLDQNPISSKGIFFSMVTCLQNVKTLFIKNDVELKEKIVKALEMSIRNSEMFITKQDLYNEVTYKLVSNVINETRNFIEDINNVNL